VKLLAPVDKVEQHLKSLWDMKKLGKKEIKLGDKFSQFLEQMKKNNSTNPAMFQLLQKSKL
jgi:hypothetical protein